MVLNKEIQGLRAVAVLAVLLAHMQVNWLPGGFVGVDVFFVISGYLITAMLAREIQQTGGIKFLSFYKRRVRRLFPAMLATCLLTVFVGFLLLGDESFDLMLDSTLAALFSVSNIYFWSQVGYFDVEAAAKPLLHTWSLGVEEQFYFIWPVLMLFALRGKSKAFGLILVIILGGISFLLNWLFIDVGIGYKLESDSNALKRFLDGPSTAFYNVPFRIFEFSIGAFIFLSGLDRLKIKLIIGDVAFFLFAFCLGLLMSRLSEESVFPNYNALWVSFVTAALIVVSRCSRLGRMILGNTPIVFIGGLSYSLYLIHWPFIVYYLAVFGDFEFFSSALLVILIFVSAWALNVLVENRFRYPPQVDHVRCLSDFISRPALPISLVAAVLVVLLLGKVENRVPEYRAEPSNQEWREIRRNNYCLDSITGFPIEIFTCQNNRNSEHTVVVWGDSHAVHLVAGLSELYENSNIAINYKNGCISQSGFGVVFNPSKSEREAQECIERNEMFLEWAKQYQGALIVIISNAKRFKPERVASINNEHVRLIQSFGHKAFVMGDFVGPGVELAQCYARPNYILSDKMLMDRCIASASYQKKQLEYSKKLAENSINYISVHESQCPDDKCRYFDDKTRLTYRDTHHLSVRGSIFEIGKVRNLIEKHFRQ
jgi:peptidoglycan/LPS O-acetylase OafA/YrhL